MQQNGYFNGISASKLWKISPLILGFLFLATILYRHPISHLIHPSSDTPLINVFHDEISDDAFYYLKIADNILTNSVSSFDGRFVTNGYQPLWMLILLGLGRIYSVESMEFVALLFATIAGIITIGSIFFFHLSGGLFSESSLVGTLCYFFSTLFLSKSGMEVGLLFVFLPLFFLLLFKIKRVPRPVNYFLLGIGASLLLLSRLDIILLFILLILCALLINPRKLALSVGLTWKNLLSGIAGLIPFLLYLLYNLLIYGNFIPVSGRAKMLHVEGGVSQTGLFSLLNTITHDKVIFLFALVFILSLPLAFLYIKRESDPLRRIMILSIILYPLIFYVYYLIVSDWPFWLWYYYPIVIAFAFGILLLENFFLRKFPVLRKKYIEVIAPTLVLLLAAASAIVLRSPPSEFIPNPLLDAAIQTKQFSEDHPGNYAMGDRAGIVGFLLGSPVIQLEGIVGDDNLLISISSQADLVDFLNNNSIDYYVATNPTKTGSCWNLEEPKIPGPSAPRMRGQICSDPIFTYTAKLDDVTTMIFQVNGNHQQP